MPVTSTVTVSYTVIGLNVDLIQGLGKAVLRRFVDGNAAGDMEFDCVGLELQAILGASPVANKTRADDIADAIYQFAIDKGYISGTVS